MEEIGLTRIAFMQRAFCQCTFCKYSDFTRLQTFGTTSSQLADKLWKPNKHWKRSGLRRDRSGWAGGLPEFGGPLQLAAIDFA